MKKDLYVVPNHKYGFGTFINKVQGSVDPDTDRYKGGLFNGMSAGLGNAMGAIGSTVGGIAGGAIAGGRESTAGNIINGLGDAASAIPGPWGAIAGFGLKAIGGLTNAAFGVKLNQENINAVNNNIATMNSFQSNAGDYDSLAQNFLSQPTAMNFDRKFIGKNGWFNNGATKEFNQLQSKQALAQQFVSNSLENNMNNIATRQGQNLLANYAAYGGPLGMITGPIDYSMAMQYLDMKNNENKDTVLAKGGRLHTHGSDWDTGINYIGNGGSHESNPFDGVQIGIAPDGQPNLVEEGEVIWNDDYVFSKRLKVPKSFRHKYKLGGPLSFACAAMKINKETEERPNDPISKRGRDTMLGVLAEVQEAKREQKEMKEQQSIQPIIAANGGYLFPIGGPIQYGPYNPLDDFNRDYLRAQFFSKEDRDRYRRFLGIAHDGPDKNWTVPELKIPEGGLGLDSYTWLKGLNDEEYEHLLKEIFPGKTKAERQKYNKYLKDRRGLFNYANTGPRRAAYNTISANTPYSQYNPEDRYLDGEGPTPITDTDWHRNLGVTVEGNTVVPATNRESAGPASPSSARVVVKRTTGDDTNEDGKTKISSWVPALRYAPVVGSAINVFSDLMGWTNKPDYSNANAILEAAKGVRDVRFNPIGDYMTYNPFDRMFYLNQLNANAGANRRTILDTTGGNRGTAIAGLLASDNNTLNSIGQMARQAEEYNLAQRQKVADFNRATNMFNSEMGLKTQQINQGASEVRMRAAQAVGAMRDAIDQRVGAARSANLTNLFESLGDIGREEFIKNMINSNPAWQYDINWLGNVGYNSAYGGKVKNKKGRR